MWSWSFNPRAHEGRDHGRMMYRAKRGFQPTRPRGARLGDGIVSTLTEVSTHAPTRGATFCSCYTA